MATLFFGFHFFSSDTWIQRLPFLQKRSAHTRCSMCPNFSTALVALLSTSLSSTDFTVSSPSSRCAMSRVYHDVALSSTHIDGQHRAGKMFETCNSNHQTRKRASFTHSICLSPCVLNLADSNSHSFISERAL